GEDDSGGSEGVDEGLVHLVPRVDLAIDPVLAHPAGDKLGDLAAVVDDQQALVMGLAHRGLSNRAMKKPSVPVRRGVSCSVWPSPANAARRSRAGSVSAGVVAA